MPRPYLHNVVLVYDVYVVAESSEAARQAAKDLVLAENPEDRLPPNDENALPVNHARAIREAWKTQAPIVAADVSDETFEQIKGKKTLEIFEILGASPKPAPAK